MSEKYYQIYLSSVVMITCVWTYFLEQSFEAFYTPPPLY